MIILRVFRVAIGPMFLAACVNGKLAFPLDEDAALPPLSAKDRCEAQQQLANFKTGEHPPGMAGSIVFDGTVKDVRAGDRGKQLVSFRIQRKLLGADLVSSDELVLIAPPVDGGGVNFGKGGRYRVFAVPLNGKVYTWDATGTFDLDRPLDCP